MDARQVSNGVIQAWFVMNNHGLERMDDISSSLITNTDEHCIVRESIGEYDVVWEVGLWGQLLGDSVVNDISKEDLTWASGW